MNQSPSRLSLAAFCAAVNTLSHAESDRLNADKTRLFGASYITYPEARLRPFHDKGMTPKTCYAVLKQGDATPL